MSELKTSQIKRLRGDREGCRVGKDSQGMKTNNGLYSLTLEKKHKSFFHYKYQDKSLSSCNSFVFKVEHNYWKLPVMSPFEAFFPPVSSWNDLGGACSRLVLAWGSRSQVGHSCCDVTNLQNMHTKYAHSPLRAVKCLPTEVLTIKETVNQMDRHNEIWPRTFEHSKVTGVRTVTSQASMNYLPLENETRTPQAQIHYKGFQNFRWRKVLFAPDMHEIYFGRDTFWTPTVP